MFLLPSPPSLQFHVTAGERPTLDKGYVTTEAPPTDSTYQPSVYALDCEMCYTTVGLQLTRVSVINMSLQPIYEKLVKPSHPIVDYNTRYHYSEQMFANESTENQLHSKASFVLSLPPPLPHQVQWSYW